jgi:hypothetical protein
LIARKPICQLSHIGVNYQLAAAGYELAIEKTVDQKYFYGGRSVENHWHWQAATMRRLFTQGSVIKQLLNGASQQKPYSSNAVGYIKN